MKRPCKNATCKILHAKCYMQNATCKMLNENVICKMLLGIIYANIWLGWFGLIGRSGLVGWFGRFGLVGLVGLVW